MSTNRYLIIIPVRQMEISTRFYEQVLGLTVIDRWQDQWTELLCGGQTLALCTENPGEATITPPRWRTGDAGTLPTFRMDDIGPALIRTPEFGGTIVSPPKVLPHGRMAIVADPDSNPLLLHEPSAVTEFW